MKPLLAVSRAIDGGNAWIFRIVMWLILVMTLVSAGNAVVRYAFDRSSNAWLEAQWYMFAGVFLCCAAFTLKSNEMVRIDIITGRCSRRVQAWIDILGTLAFLLPICLMMIKLSWPVFVQAYDTGEMSSNAGGLIVWPARLLVPVGFTLLALQGISELIKLVAFLSGAGPDPHAKTDEKTAEERLAEDIAKMRGEHA